MADFNDIVKVAVDAYRGNVKNYSVDQSMELLNKALVEANNGNTTLNYRDLRDGKCAGLFSLIEVMLSKTVPGGLTGNEFFNSLVDFRNVAAGDKNVFLTEDSDLFYVAKMADGTQGIRRQRMSGVSEFSVNTERYGVKIYEEMDRILAGRIDFNEMIRRVSESFSKLLLDQVYAIWSNVTAEQLGGVNYFPAAGAYDEEELLNLIAHVEAASDGKTATIIGTKKALRNLAPSIHGADSQSDLYNMGYYGKFYGNPVVAVPQRYKMNSTDFIMPDDMLTIIAGDDKPIKCVYEGSPLVIMGDPLTNGDLTSEYMFSDKWGMAFVMANGNSGIGRYQIA